MTQSEERPDPLAEPVDLVLRVATRKEGGDQILEYRLHSPSGAAGKISGRVHPSRSLGAPDAFRRDLLRELERLRSAAGIEETTLSRQEVQDTLTDIGRWLYQRLFSESMRETWRDLPKEVRTLIVVSDEPWIPWEIVRPADDDFFCIRFEMGRWLDEAADPAIVKGVRRLLCLVVPEPGVRAALSALSEASAESKLLEGFAGNGGDVVDLRDGFGDELKARLREGVDLLHFAGHGKHRESSVEDAEGTWRPELAQIELADRPFRARELGGEVALRLRQDRPFVFFNSCEGGRLGWALTGLGGWAQAWVEDCGASGFLAPFLSVSDTASRELASTFYRGLQEGRTVGDALRTARGELREPKEAKDDTKRSVHDDLAWLAYSLHAHPNLRLVPGKDVIETVSVRPPPLKLPELDWRPDLSPPGALLRAEYGIVPFHFRKTEVEDLDTWCRSEKRVGIRLYTGAGGMGKTRLALELCRRLRADGWQAGLVDPERLPEETWRDLSEIGGPRLLIVDYAETRRPLLVPLLREIYKSENDAPIRVLLLARAALDWWEQLKTEGDGVGELLSGPATRWYTLQPLALSTEGRAESYRTAAEAFAERLGKRVPEETPEDFDAEEYKRVLLLHMRALAAIDGVVVKDEDGILDYVLDRERRFWGRLATERELPREVATGIGRAMAAITLGGGVDGEEQAVQVMRELTYFRDKLAYFKDEKESVLRTVARLLSDTYPGENKWIEPVMPDLLGEHLIMREMEVDSTELLDLVLGPARPVGEGAPS